MTLQPVMRTVAMSALLCAGVFLHSDTSRAQVFDFGQIDAFESLGSGTQRGGSPPKTIVDDGERHTVFFTIFESNTGREGISDRRHVQGRSARRRQPQLQIWLCAAPPEE
jgi:hypothetical protein